MGLKICSLASGSKGNCCFVSDGKNNILIDLGISATRVERCLSVLGANSDSVDIFVTHSHSDHINGLKVFCKKHPRAVVHCQRETAGAVSSHCGIAPRTDARTVAVGGLTVTAVPVPHDVPCFGYIVESEHKRVAVVTDVGEIVRDTLSALCGCDVVMLEANHDPERLRRNSAYTPQLKARIRSRYGHLSNPDCADACAYLAAGGVKNFILAHLSEENNDPELAASEVERGIRVNAGVTDARVVVATQNSMTGLFEVC